MCGLVHPFFQQSRWPPAARQYAQQCKYASADATRSAIPAGLAQLCQGRFKREAIPCSQGGSRLRGNTAPLGAGNRPRPASTAVTRKRSCPQHGHKPTSSLATRAMNAWAHSSARELSAGICKAARAVASLTALQLDANTPEWRIRLMPLGRMCSMKRRTNSAPSRRTSRLPP